MALLASLDMLFVASALLARGLFLVVLLIVRHGHSSTCTGMVRRPNRGDQKKFHPQRLNVMQRTKRTLSSFAPRCRRSSALSAGWRSGLLAKHLQSLPIASAALRVLAVKTQIIPQIGDLDRSGNWIGAGTLHKEQMVFIIATRDGIER